MVGCDTEQFLFSLNRKGKHRMLRASGGREGERMSIYREWDFPQPTGRTAKHIGASVTVNRGHLMIFVSRCLNCSASGHDLI